ncbi:MAG: low temperature requirement protein A [Acidimicrobiales bacterium]|nr:low temperature requirement protein A [Acidimicrobiales bacterium]
MRGIELPERTEDFTADPVELFFDLAYVLAFSQLVGHLVHHPTWRGVGEAALLLWLLWLPWSQFTWSANAVSGNGRTVRVLFLVGTAISVPMAASVSTAFGPGGPVFAVSLALIYALAASTMALGVERGSDVYRSIRSFGLLSAAGTVVLIAGSFLDGGPRVAAWILSGAIVLVAMLLSGDGTWIVRVGHFAERHGLIVIIALGEVIVAIGLPVVDSLEAGEGVPARTLVALAASAVFASLVWWGYFDRPGPALEHRGQQLDEGDRGRYVRDVYTLGHVWIVAGIILSATALETIALHPAEPVSVAFRAMFAGGLALAVAGVAFGVWVAFRVVAVERVVFVVALVLLILALGSLDGLWVLIGVDVLIALTLVVEHRRIEHPAAAGA